MDVNISDKVYLSLETYEEMKHKIKYLEKLVLEKTIVKEVYPSWVELLIIITIITILTFIFGVFYINS